MFLEVILKKKPHKRPFCEKGDLSREKLDQQEINGLIKKFTSFQADQRVLCFNLNILTDMSAKTVQIRSNCPKSAVYAAI